MAASSKAAVLLEPTRMELRELPLPEVGPDDGLLRIEVTGVCGSDWPAYSVGLPIYETPCVLGHEMVGRIERVGAEAAERWGVREGDRVAVEEYLPCGLCRSCLEGYYQMCSVPRYGGKSIHAGSGLWGGFSEFLYLDPRALVHKLSDDVPVELTQLFVPISNGLYWVQEAGGLNVGETVVVLGPGPHGLGCVIGAKEAGAGLVIVVGLSADAQRLDVARRLGADVALRADVDDLVEQVREATGGRMAETVVNLAPAAESLQTALELAGERATVLQLGLAERPANGIDVDQMMYKALTVKGVRGRPSRLIPPTLRLIESGRYPLEAMCTHRFGIEETEQAIQLVGSGSAELIRAYVQPD